MENTEKLLTWAAENIGPLAEIKAINDSVCVRLQDGRAGFLVIGADGKPMANLPPEVGI